MTNKLLQTVGFLAVVFISLIQANEFDDAKRNAQIKLVAIKQKLAQLEELPLDDQETLIKMSDDDEHLDKEAYTQAMIQERTGANQECNAKSLSIPVLDKVPSIGELYDARTDFLHIGERLWYADEKISKAEILEQHMGQTKYHFEWEQDMQDKLHNLGFNAELSVSYQSDDEEDPLSVSVRGEGEYLGNHKSSNQVQRAILTLSMDTVGQKIKDLSGMEYLWDQFQRKDVTHVVTGIQWGSSAQAVIDYEQEDSDDEQITRGMLEVIVQTGDISISASADLKWTSEQKEFMKKFKIAVFADVNTGAALPTDFPAALEYLKSVPGFIKKSNDGKGRARSMVLTPLCLVKQNVPKQQLVLNAFYQEIKANTLLQLQKDYKEMDQVSLDLLTLKKRFESAPKAMVGEKRLTDLKTHILEFVKYKNDKKALIRAIMLTFRSGDEATGNKQIDQLNEFKKKSPHNTVIVSKFITEQNSLLKKKISVVNALKSRQNGTTHVAKVVNFDLIAEWGEPTRNKIILYYTVDKFIDKADDNFVFFEQCMRYYKPFNTDYFILLHDLIPKYAPKSGAPVTKIEFYQPAGRFKRYLKLTTDDYTKYDTHLAAVIINPEETVAQKKLFYQGTLDQKELRKGSGDLYINADRVYSDLKAGREQSANQNKVYQGEWNNDLFEGDGLIYNNGKLKCEGKFTKGNTNGFIQCYDNYGQYKGQLNSIGQKHGDGVIYVDVKEKPDVTCEHEWANDISQKVVQCFKKGKVISITEAQASVTSSNVKKLIAEQQTFVNDNQESIEAPDTAKDTFNPADIQASEGSKKDLSTTGDKTTDSPKDPNSQPGSTNDSGKGSEIKGEEPIIYNLLEKKQSKHSKKSNLRNKGHKQDEI